MKLDLEKCYPLNLQAKEESKCKSPITLGDIARVNDLWIKARTQKQFYADALRYWKRKREER